jgi:hypothetical protein
MDGAYGLHWAGVYLFASLGFGRQAVVWLGRCGGTATVPNTVDAIQKRARRSALVQHEYVHGSERKVDGSWTGTRRVTDADACATMDHVTARRSPLPVSDRAATLKPSARLSSYPLYPLLSRLPYLLRLGPCTFSPSPDSCLVYIVTLPRLGDSKSNGDQQLPLQHGSTHASATASLSRLGPHRCQSPQAPLGLDSSMGQLVSAVLHRVPRGTSLTPPQLSKVLLCVQPAPRCR